MANISSTGVQSGNVGRLVRSGSIVHQLRYTTPTLAFLLGMPAVDENREYDATNPFTALQFERLQPLESDKIEVAVDRGLSAGGVLTPANMFGAAGTTAENTLEVYGFEARWYQKLVHLNKRDVLEDKELGWRLPAQVADNVAVSLTKRWMNDVSAELFSSAAGAIGTGKLGSIYHAVTDGLTAVERGSGTDESAYVTYFTGVARNVAGNEWSQAQYQDVNATLTIATLEAAIDATFAAGGKADVVVLPVAIFSRLKSSYTFNPMQSSMDGINTFGIPRFFVLGNTLVIADPACPSNRGYILDSSTWTIGHTIAEDAVLRERNDVRFGVSIAHTSKTAVICSAPKFNRVLARIS